MHMFTVSGWKRNKGKEKPDASVKPSNLHGTDVFHANFLLTVAAQVGTDGVYMFKRRHMGGMKSCLGL